jgi:hypothetical protein
MPRCNEDRVVFHNPSSCGDLANHRIREERFPGVITNLVSACQPTAGPVEEGGSFFSLKVRRRLRLCSGGSSRSLLKNRGCLADVRDTKKDERHIRTGLQTAICVIDVDVGLSQAGCYPRLFRPASARLQIFRERFELFICERLPEELLETFERHRADVWEMYLL